MRILFRTVHISFFALAVFFLSVSYTAHAQLSTCNTYHAYHKTPAGFGAVYDVFASNKEILMNATDCTSTGFNALIGHAGKTPSNFAVYEKGYVWNGSQWVQISYAPDGGTKNGVYLMGNAKFASRSKYYGINTFFVAFTCSKVSGAWKCGCRDNTCSQSYWQLQGATKGYDIAAGGGGGGGGATTGSGGYASGAGAPIKVSGDGHYLLNRNNEPFLWAGDTQWILNSHTDSEIRQILDDRKAKGFSVIQIFLTRNWIANSGPDADGRYSRDSNGALPFQNNDIATPNDAYFDRFRFIADEAASRGLIISLNAGEPARGEQPWPAGNKERAYGYGYYLGQKFLDKKNIIWNAGQDMVGSGGMGVDAWRAIAEGIADGINSTGKSYNGSADYSTTFITFHPAGGTKSSWHFHNDGWLDANAFQCWATPQDIWSFAFDDYKLSPVKPTLNIEASYEEGPEYGIQITPRVVRQQAYHAYFGGAAGHTYGHNCNWRGCINLNTGGAQGVSYLFAWLRAHAWHTFEPDQNIIAEGEEGGTNRKTAVKAQGGKALYIYFPNNSGAKIRLSRASTGQLSASWFNPVNGTVVNDRVYQTSDEPWMTPPSGWEDAVLLFE